MSQAKPKKLPYPVANLIHDSVYQKYRFWRCMMLDESPLITKSCTDKSLEPQYCFAQEYSFPRLLLHIKKVHDVKLHPSLDFCTDCSTIFSSRYMAIFHYLNKVLNYHRNSISHDDTPFTCEECHEHMKAIRRALTHFSKEIKFEDLYTEKTTEEEDIEHVYKEEALKELEEAREDWKNDDDMNDEIEHMTQEMVEEEDDIEPN